MCTPTCLEFVKRSLLLDDLSHSDVLEVGSYNVNGSCRDTVLPRSRTYLGVDIEDGPGVDQICRAEDLVETFGKDRFDVVITTEMLEHVEDWRTVMTNLKNVTKPGGLLIITTRSKGFGYHGYPSDFWRYEKSDMENIFGDWEILKLEDDPAEHEHPSFRGVFVKARKPVMPSHIKVNFSAIELYAMEQPPDDPTERCENCPEEIEMVTLPYEDRRLGTVANFMGFIHTVSRKNECANGTTYATPRSTFSPVRTKARDA